MRTELDLSIISYGAISPGGIGVEALMETVDWPTTEIRALANPDKTWSCAAVSEAEIIQEMRKHKRLRRVSAISHFMVEAGKQALANAPEPIDHARVGIICGLFVGGVVYCRKFFKQIIEDGQKFASPALFPDTVFNAPASHLAAYLKLDGPCYTLVGDDSAWTDAVQAAHTWLTNDTVDHVLIVAAEELEPLVIEGHEQLGWLRQQGRNPIRPAEGAGAILLTKPSNATLATVSIKASHAGHYYSKYAELRSVAQAWLNEVSEDLPIMRTANSGWMQKIEAQLLQQRKTFCVDKHASLEGGFIASAAWQTIRASQLLTSGHSCVVPVWGASNSLTSLELRRL